MGVHPKFCVFFFFYMPCSVRVPGDHDPQWLKPISPWPNWRWCSHNSQPTAHMVTHSGPCTLEARVTTTCMSALVPERLRPCVWLHDDHMCDDCVPEMEGGDGACVSEARCGCGLKPGGRRRRQCRFKLRGWRRRRCGLELGGVRARGGTMVVQARVRRGAGTTATGMYTQVENPGPATATNNRCSSKNIW